MSSVLSLLDSLLRLEQHAEGRRVAAKALAEAVELWADEIVARLRAGDAVVVDNHPIAVRNVGYYATQSGSGWPVVTSRATWPCLVVDGCEVAAPPADQSWHDGHNTQHQIPGRLYLSLLGGDDDARPARRQTLTWLGEHAAAITAAFADQLKADRERMTQAAEAAQTGRV